MSVIQSASLPSSVAEDFNAGFMVMLPKIECQLRQEFRDLGVDAAEEALQEATAHCYLAFTRLCQQDRADAAHPSTLAGFAARQVRAGRKVAGSLNVRDPLSKYAQRRKKIRVESINRRSAKTGEWIEAAVVGERTPILERVALRIDVPQWLKHLSSRMQQIAKDLAVGCTTREVADKHGLTPGRIAQIRRELHLSWERFHMNRSVAD